MENYLGRKLDRREVVHHINGNTKDNRIENLQLMNLSEHGKLHMSGKVLSEETKSKISLLLKGKSTPWTTKHSLADAVYVRKLHQEGFTQRAISEMTGVSKSIIHRMIHGTQLCYREEQSIYRAELAGLVMAGRSN
jgi:uncharacterized protein YerC